MGYKIPVKVFNIKMAEYLHPANHTIQLLFEDETWMLVDKWKDFDIYTAVVEFAALKDNNFTIMEFGAKAKQDEEKLRAFIQEETQKILAAQQEAVLLENTKKTPEVVSDPVITHVLEPISTPPIGVTLPSPVSTISVEVNKEDTTKPTMMITVPEVVAPIMEATVTNVVNNINSASIDPQIEVKLVPVEHAVPNMTATQVVTSSVDAANIALVATTADVDLVNAAGASLTKVVEQALEIANPVLPVKAEEVEEVPLAPPVVPTAPPMEVVKEG